MDDFNLEWYEAASLVSDWRSSHAHPLNVFRTNLRRRAKRDAIVAQRLKRLPTIIAKLQRLPRIPLSQMQDIGGCRAVVDNSDTAFRLAADLAGSKTRHELISYNNYIDSPRTSGYRGLHLVYAYNPGRHTQWNGLRTEIQIRSRLQHQWATAVETVGTFIGEDLKPSEGNPTWLRFFALMSTAIARRENTPTAPDTPTDIGELEKEIRECDQRLAITEQLAAFQLLTHQFQGIKKNDWVVLELDMEAEEIRLMTFGAAGWESANSHYLNRELETKDNSRVQIVLVSTNSLTALRRVYPNFFLDLREFRRVVSETLENS